MNKQRLYDAFVVSNRVNNISARFANTNRRIPIGNRVNESATTSVFLYYSLSSPYISLARRQRNFEQGARASNNSKIQCNAMCKAIHVVSVVVAPYVSEHLNSKFKRNGEIGFNFSSFKHRSKVSLHYFMPVTTGFYICVK